MQLSRGLGFSAASLLLIAARAAADAGWSGWAFTTVTPCPDCPTDVAPPPITVTTQYQPVSTCAATFTKCWNSTCMTSYSYTEWDYVSTVIPCEYDGDWSTKTTVTTTDQVVTVSKWSTTVTTYSTYTTTIPFTGKWKSGSHGSWAPKTITKTTSTPVPTTISKDYCAEYDNLGGFVLPGWGGSDLCPECAPHSDGSKWQALNVTECQYSPYGYRCKEYPETWVSVPAPTKTSATTASCSSKLSATGAGTWTFTFPFTAPPPPHQTDGSNTWSWGPAPWSWYVTKTCTGPSSWDYTTTVTKTVTYTVPWSTSGSSKPTDPIYTGGNGWEPWNPSTTTAPPKPTGTVIQVYDVGVKYYHGGPQYIGWANDDAIVVSDISEAATFDIVEGMLTCDGGVVGAESSWGFAPFEKFGSPPPVSSGWSEGADGSLTWGGYQFCVSTDNSIFVEFSSPPSFPCKPVVLGCGDYQPGTTTTTPPWTSPTGTGWESWTTPSTTWISDGSKTWTSDPSTSWTSASGTVWSTWTTPTTTTTWTHTTTWTSATPNPSSDPDPDMPGDGPEVDPLPKRSAHLEAIKRRAAHRHRF